MKSVNFKGLLRMVTLRQAIVFSACIASIFYMDICKAQTTWNTVATSPTPITSIAYGNGMFVGCGGGMWAVSLNGSSWSFYESPPVLYTCKINYGNGTFVAYGTNSQFKENLILSSTNGTSWKTIYTSANLLSGAAFGNNTWVFIGTNELITVNTGSTNQIWTDYQPAFSPFSVTFGNGIFVISTTNNSIYSSTDGLSWQYDTILNSVANSPTSQIIYGDGVFVQQFSQSTDNNYVFQNWLFVSSDGVNWSQPTGTKFSNSSGSPYNDALLGFGGNEFFMVFQTNYQATYPQQLYYTSTDGNTWATNNPFVSSLPNLSGLTYGQGKFIGFSGNKIYQSNVFITGLSTYTTLGISTYSGVIINGTPGGVYQIQYATSLNSPWATITNLVLPYSPYIWVDTSTPIAGQRFYQSIQLQ